MIGFEVRMGEAALKLDHITIEDYIEMENASNEKHMFWDGEIFAMSGASPDHYEIEMNVAGLLYTQQRNQPCRPFTGNVRLRALGSERSVYADAVVVCGPKVPHPGDGNALTNPTVIVEVLSDSTESFDRGDKFAYYRTFPSVQEVLLVSQKQMQVEHFRRAEGGSWVLRVYRDGESVVLASVGAQLAVADLYEGSSLKPPTAPGS